MLGKRADVDVYHYCSKGAWEWSDSGNWKGRGVENLGMKVTYRPKEKLLWAGKLNLRSDFTSTGRGVLGLEIWGEDWSVLVGEV